MKRFTNVLDVIYGFEQNNVQEEVYEYGVNLTSFLSFPYMFSLNLLNLVTYTFVMKRLGPATSCLRD